MSAPLFAALIIHLLAGAAPDARDVLIPLGHCLSQLSERTAETIITPCARQPVASILGATRADVRAYLGLPRSCRDTPASTSGRLGACDRALVWTYSFYRLADNHVG